jgi:hypothetical protein
MQCKQKRCLGIITGLACPRVWRKGCRRGGHGFEISTRDQPSPAARVGFYPHGFFFSPPHGGGFAFSCCQIIHLSPLLPPTDVWSAAASRRDSVLGSSIQFSSSHPMRERTAPDQSIKLFQTDTCLDQRAQSTINERVALFSVYDTPLKGPFEPVFQSSVNRFTSS